MTNTMIAKVNDELKAQGINATSAQIESALKEVISKQELNEDDLDNVAGGFNPAALIPLIPTAIDVIKKVTGGGDKKEEKKDGGNGGNGGNGGYSNTNDGGKQMNNQGQNNSNNNSGTMTW